MLTVPQIKTTNKQIGIHDPLLWVKSELGTVYIYYTRIQYLLVIDKCLYYTFWATCSNYF